MVKKNLYPNPCSSRIPRRTVRERLRSIPGTDAVVQHSYSGYATRNATRNAVASLQVPTTLDSVVTAASGQNA